MTYIPIYSGPNRSGICKCGHSWRTHHLSIVAKKEYHEATGEGYMPDECLAFGCNEMGGLDREGNVHCFGYEDSLS